MAIPSENRRALDYCILASILVVAVLIRAPGLGKWCFTIDEYYYYNSVSFILDKGVPQFPGGGYYFRGPLVQYLIALSSLVFPEKEFAARLVPLICGVFSVPLFYLICRRFLSVLPAFLCSLILLFSSWHIEFSRFARMYAPFQFAFFSFIYFFHSGYFMKNGSHKIICWVIAFLSIFVYEGSIFLPFLLLLPVLMDEVPWNRRSLGILCLFSGLLVANYLVTGINYRGMGVTDPYPAGFAISQHGMDIPFSLPESNLLRTVFKSIPLLLAYLLIVLGGVCVHVRQWKKRTGFWERVSISVAALLPLVYQYGLLVFLLLIIIVSHKTILSMFLEEGRWWVPYILTTMAFWCFIGSFPDGAQSMTGDISIYFQKMFSYLFAYPKIYKAILLPFSKATPLWGTVLFVALFASIVHYLFSNVTDGRGFLLPVLFVCLLLVSTIKTLYAETRYSFFYFPLFYILGYMEIVSLRDFAGRRLNKLP